MLCDNSYTKCTVQTDAMTSVYEFVNQYSLFEVFQIPIFIFIFHTS